MLSRFTFTMRTDDMHKALKWRERMGLLRSSKPGKEDKIQKCLQQVDCLRSSRPDLVISTSVEGQARDLQIACTIDFQN